MLRRLLLTPALMVIAFPAAAGTFDDAVAALKRGDCDMAPKLMRDAAGQDNILAQFNLGAMYATGDCVPQDYAESAKWLRRAAEQGDAAAQTNLGAKYFKGEGVAIHEPPLAGLAKSKWPLGTAVHFAYRPLAYSVDDAISAALASGEIAKIFAAYGLTHNPPEW